MDTIDANPVRDDFNVGTFLNVAVPGVIGLASLSSLAQIITGSNTEQEGDDPRVIMPTRDEVRQAGMMDPDHMKKSFFQK